MPFSTPAPRARAQHDVRPASASSVSSSRASARSVGASRAADRISQKMQALSFEQYQRVRIPANGTPRSGLDDLFEGVPVQSRVPVRKALRTTQFVDEIQGPKSSKLIAVHYDPDVSLVLARGRRTVLSLPSGTVWCQPQPADDGRRGVIHSESKSGGSRAPDQVNQQSRLPSSKLNARIKRCSSAKQSLQARLLAQVRACHCDPHA